MAELVEHERTGLLVEPGDSVALAQAVTRLSSHPEQLPTMRAGARRVRIAVAAALLRRGSDRFIAARS